MAVDVPFANPFTQIIHLSISYLYEVRIFYFADVDMGSSEVLADLPQVTVGRAKAGREVCLMPKSLFFFLHCLLSSFLSSLEQETTFWPKCPLHSYLVSEQEFLLRISEHCWQFLLPNALS